MAEQPLVGFRDSPTVAQVIAAFRGEGIEPHWAFRSNDNPTVQGLVGAGVGVAVMPRLTVNADDPSIAVVELATEVPPRIVAVAQHRDRYSSPAARAFVQTAREVALLDRDRLGEVARLVDVQAAQARNPIRE